MEKTRLAFDSDATTEETGEEVHSEVEAPLPTDPKGNPHDLLDEKPVKDGVPLDDPNPEHLAKEVVVKEMNYKARSIIITEDEAEQFSFRVDDDYEGGDFHSPDQAATAAKKYIDSDRMSHGAHLSSKRVSYKGKTATIVDDGETWEVQDSDGNRVCQGGSYEQAFKLFMKMVDSNNYDLSKGPTEPNNQQPERLVSVIEHEGHSASVHASEAGHTVKGKGSTSYMRSEPIASKEHAEEYALSMLKAHAKLSEKELLHKHTNLSEVDSHASSWEGVPKKEKREHWANLTGANKNKLTACINSVDGHVPSPGAYCMALANEVGYKVE